MRTTIDAGGRVVIPKELREMLGLRAGQTVDVAIADGRISIDPIGTGMHLEYRGGVPEAVADEPIDPLSAATVRTTLERLRR